MDGTTDAGKVEDELIAVMYCSKDDVSKEIKSQVRFIGVEVPERADAKELMRMGSLLVHKSHLKALVLSTYSVKIVY